MPLSVVATSLAPKAFLLQMKTRQLNIFHWINIISKTVFEMCLLPSPAAMHFSVSAIDAAF